MGELEKCAKPLLVCLSILFDGFRVVRTANHGEKCDDQYAHQWVTNPSRNSRVRQVCEISLEILDLRRWLHDDLRCHRQEDVPTEIVDHMLCVPSTTFAHLEYVSPLQGYDFICNFIPRALPWAVIFHPFGVRALGP